MSETALLQPIERPVDDAPPALKEIYDALVLKAEDAIRWYETRQRTKKAGARLVRSLAILLGAATAIIPSLIAMLPDNPAFPPLRWNPIATITGVGAATAILFDKFYGFSTSWARYVSTYLAIKRALDDFKIGWRKEILKLNSNMPPTDEQILAVYDFLGGFLQSVNDLVRTETEAWLTDFKGALGDIDKTVEGQKSAAIAAPLRSAAKGVIGIELVLSDTAKLDDATWTLQLDNRKPEVKVGQSTATIPSLDPGIYKLRIAGQRDGKPVATEYPVKVTGDGVSTVKVDRLG